MKINWKINFKKKKNTTKFFKLSPTPNESMKIELKDIIFQYFQKCHLLILRRKKIIFLKNTFI